MPPSKKEETASPVLPLLEAGIVSVFTIKSAKSRIKTLSSLILSARTLPLKKRGHSYKYRNNYPLEVFAQAICAGFENTTSQPTSDNSPTNSVVTHESPLKKIHENIARSFSLASLQKQALRLRNSFKNALNIQLKQIKDVDAALIQNISSGDDLLRPFKKDISINKRLRAFHHLYAEKEPIWTFFENCLEITTSICSATCSTIFVEISDVGRFIGENLALLSKCFFDIEVSSKYILPTLLVTMFLFKETLDVMKECSKFVLNAIYYPMIFGLITGIYDSLEKQFPGTLNRFGASINNIEKKSILEIAKEALKNARKKLEKYDKDQEPDTKYEDEIVSALEESPLSSKNFLAGRHKFLSLFNHHKNARSLKKVILILRAGILTTQSFLSKMVFSGVKFSTSSISSLLSTSLRSLFSKTQPTDYEITTNITENSATSTETNNDNLSNKIS